MAGLTSPPRPASLLPGRRASGRRRVWGLAACFLLALVVLAGTAWGQEECDIEWTGAGEDSSWHNPANWSGEGVVPGEDDDVCIDLALNLPVVYDTGDLTIGSLTSDLTADVLHVASGTLTLGAASSIIGGGIEVTGDGVLAVAGGDLTVARLRLAEPTPEFVLPVVDVAENRTMTITGPGQGNDAALDWEAGGLPGPGETIVEDSATLTSTGTKSIFFGRLTLQGVSIWDGGFLSFSSGGGIRNEGSLTIVGQRTMSGPTGVILRNAEGATLTKTGEGVANMGGILINDGDVEVVEGTLRLPGNCCNSSLHGGDFSISEGATLDFRAIFGHRISGGTITGPGVLRNERRLELDGAVLDGVALEHAGTFAVLWLLGPPSTPTVARNGTAITNAAEFLVRHRSALHHGGGDPTTFVNTDTGTLTLGQGVGTHEVLLQVEVETAGEMVVRTNDRAVVTGGVDQTDGTVELEDGSTLVTPQLSISGEGRLIGEGTVEGDVDNDGTVAPGASTGTLAVDGDYEQGVDGSFEVELGGTDEGEFDILEVTDAVALNSTLTVELVDDFVPEIGDEFLVLTADDVEGTFDVHDLADLGEDGRLGIRYDDDAVVILVIDASCDAYWLGSDSDSWHTPGNWLDDTLPATGQTVCIEEDNNLPVVYSEGETTIAALHSGDFLGLGEEDDPVLEITGGTLTVEGDSEVQHSLVLDGGVLELQDTLAVGALGWTDGTIGGGNLTVARSLDLSGDLTLAEEAELRNDGTMTIDTPTMTLGGGGEPGTLLNLGTLIHDVDPQPFGSETRIMVPFENKDGATVDLDAGRLMLLHDAVNDGTITAAPGTHLTLGPATPLPSVTFEGEGSLSAGRLTFRQVEATLDGQVAATGIVSVGFNGTADVSFGDTVQFEDNLSLAGESTIRGDGEIQVKGDLLLREGTIADSEGDVRVTGDLRLETGGIKTLEGRDLVVDSSAEHAAGLFIIEATGSLDVDGAYQQPGGHLHLDGGLNAGGYRLGEEARLSGSGLLESSLDAEGAVSPGGSVGTLTVDLDYTQTDTGLLEIELAGTDEGQHDVLAVVGDAGLDGTLVVTLLDDFAPSSGDSFTILTAASVEGAFATTALPDLPGRDRFTVAHEDERVDLLVVTDPSPSGPAAPGPVTVSTGDEATEDEPLVVTVTSPQGGPVEVEVVETESAPPAGWVFADVKALIEAPDSTPENPIVIEFRLHASQLQEGQDHTDVEVLRDGEFVPDCADPDGGVADPDPCVQSRETVGDEIVIVVLTSQASTWHLALPEVDTEPEPEPETETELCPPAAFPDVDPDSVHADAIACAAFHGIAHGFADGTYGPALPVRRDQMASFIVRTLEAGGYALPAASHGFIDLGGNVHADAVGRLAAAGIVRGTTATTYSPGQPVRRDQMASFLVRALEWALGTDLSATGGPHFNDTAGNVHEAAIDVAFEWGLTAGTAPGTYSPALDVRRDQMATFLIRLLDRIA